MPLRPGKACRVNTCPNIVKDMQHRGFCVTHKDRAGWNDNERLNGNRHQRGYGTQWNRIRSVVLRRDASLCQSCKSQGRFTKATHVDHIKAKSKGGTDELVNLQSLCVDCHNTKTGKE